jgi:methionine synthase I (cobalamin-dependent)
MNDDMDYEKGIFVFDGAFGTSLANLGYKTEVLFQLSYKNEEFLN